MMCHLYKGSQITKKLWLKAINEVFAIQLDAGSHFELQNFVFSPYLLDCHIINMFQYIKITKLQFFELIFYFHLCPAKIAS